MGESGSGKTTLAKMVIGLIEPDGGEVRLEGDAVGRRTKEFYERVQMIYQNPKESISHRMNVQEAVEEPLVVQNARCGKSERVKAVLEEAELPGDGAFLKKYPHQLSGGEKVRVSLALLLATRPKLLILDEPFGDIDPITLRDVSNAIKRINAEYGTTIFLVSHHVDFVREISHRAILMEDGGIVMDGDSNETCDVFISRCNASYLRSADLDTDDNV